MALAASVAIAVAGAMLWGLVAMLFKTQLSIFGLLIGGGIGAVVTRCRGAHWPTMAAGAVIAVAGCALGTLLGLVFVAVDSGSSLSFVLSHLSGPSGLLRYYPGSVGILGLLFWVVAAGAVIAIPLRAKPTLPDQAQAVQAEPVQTEPVQTEPVQTEPVQAQAVQAQAVQAEPVQAQPGDEPGS